MKFDELTAIITNLVLVFSTNFRHQSTTAKIQTMLTELFFISLTNLQAFMLSLANIANVERGIFYCFRTKRPEHNSASSSKHVRVFFTRKSTHSVSTNTFYHFQLCRETCQHNIYCFASAHLIAVH